MMPDMSWIATLSLLVTVLFPAQDPSPKAILLAAGETFSERESEIFIADETLWLAEEKFSLATGFERKPEGLCREDICIRTPNDGSWEQVYEERNYLDLSSFAERLDQALVRDEEHEVWALAEAPLLQGRELGTGLAPDFELPDLEGRKRRLSEFRGKKVLLLTWASW